MKISKSRYADYKVCPKLLWLGVNKPDLAVEDPTAQKHIDDGKTVGDVAKKLFKDTIDVTTFDEEGNLDINNMIGLTNRYLLTNEYVIAEASIAIDNLFCSVDLLKPNGDKYDIYEVKATTGIEKEHYLDAAFQKYVLEKRGLPVNRVYLVHLNNDYRRKGELDLNGLFIKDDITEEPKFLSALMNVQADVDDINILMKEKSEPVMGYRTSCKGCPYQKYCLKDLPDPNIMNINGIRGWADYINVGIVTYLDALTNHVKLNNRQMVQVDTYLHNRVRVIDTKKVKDFLSTVTYPVYHLDFESIMLPIPPADDCWPYEQIPTQYSLHIEYVDGRLEHKEFLGDSIDPRRGIAEALCRDIPADVCVLAYNKTFECGRLKELAELYDDLHDHLMAIHDNVVDLIVPFKNGAFYDEKMGGSNSIKYVLPALYPDDPELDYHALPVVHNGGEAMDIYPKMLAASPEEQKRIRDGLLKYCCLDTLAMVKVLRKLVESVK